MRVITILFALILANSISAQTPNDVQEQIKKLESQVQAMQAELDRLKKATTPAPVAKTETPAAVSEKKSEPETKISGIELGNGVRAIPYGTIYFNLYGNDAGTNNADIPLFAATAGRGNTSASIRQTRFGLRIEGVKFGKAKITGVVETDFYGGSPAVSTGENFGVVRVRLANVKLDWKDTSLTIGQDWMPYAPQSPVSIADAAIPQFAAAGNNWARLPQVKVEQRFNDGRIVWQGAVLAPQTGDSSAVSNFLQQPNSGALSRVPFIQTRIGLNGKNWFGSKKAGTIGLSGHYGQSFVTSTTAPIADSKIDSYGVALDWNVWLTKRVVWTGEVFRGQNLGGFQAGIFQSYNTDCAVRVGNVLTPTGVCAIRTKGGWTQVGLIPKVAGDRIAFYGSIGLDDPEGDDLINTRNRDFRTRNLAWALDAIYKLTPQLQFGIEFRQMNTGYLITGRRRANHFNLGAAYSF